MLVLPASPENWRVLVDQREGTLQDGSGRTPILLQNHQLGPGKMSLKQTERRAWGPADAVDRLGGIADREDTTLFARTPGKNFYLCEVGALKLINQNESRTGAFSGKEIIVLVQQFVSPRDHVAKRAQVFFLEHSLDGSENPGNFLAALHDLVIGE